MGLLPYGDAPGIYTQVSDAGDPTGMLMIGDAQGTVHPLMPLKTFERYRIESGRLRNATLVRPNPAEGTMLAANRHYVAVGEDYVEVLRDKSLSSGRAVWRVATPRGTRPDPVVHRLIRDREAGVWRRPDPEEIGLPGGGAGYSTRRLGDVEALIQRGDISPAATHEFQEILVQSAGAVATPQQTDALRALLRRIDSSPRGASILRAMRAYHQSHSLSPKIVFSTAGEQAARPTLAARERTFTWHLDLAALDQATPKAAVDELAAVYNNMTGILESGHRLMSPVSGAPFSAELEAAWRQWMAAEEDKSPLEFWDHRNHRFREHGSSTRTNAIEGLRVQLEELRAYGGISGAALRQVMRADTEAEAENILVRGAAVRLNARHRLTSLPPMPDDVRTLDISGTPIRDWRNLPQGLVKFSARNSRLSRLPPNLPRTIRHLDVSHNVFLKLNLWEGLETVRLDYTHAGGVVALPGSVVSLEARSSEIRKLVMSSTSRLRKLAMSRSAVTVIRGALPATLESIDLSYCHFLRELPGFVLPRLTHLSLAGVRLRLVPALPPGLRYLNLSHNWSPFVEDQLQIPAHVMNLADCEIDVHFTGITQANLPPVPIGQAGPRFLHLAQVADQLAQGPRPIEQVVAGWFDGGNPEHAAALATAQARWANIALAAGPERNFAEFRVFVDRLAETENARDPLLAAAFRAQVRDWLIECSRPERAALRETTFAACLEANGSCQDRTSWTFTQLKSLRVNDDIALGLYDGRVPEVIGAAREAHAKDALEKIASRKADAIDAARKFEAETIGGVGAYYPPCNRLDIYLAYLVELGPRAGVNGTGASIMRFFESAGVSQAEIAQSWPELQQRLAGPEFETFLSRDFFPWKALMRRNFREPYQAVETQLQNTMEATMAARINAEISMLGLDPADPAAAVLIDDVVGHLGPLIQREIEDAAFQNLTRQFLQANNLTHLVPPAVQVAGHA